MWDGHDAGNIISAKVTTLTERTSGENTYRIAIQAFTRRLGEFTAAVASLAG